MTVPSKIQYLMGSGLGPDLPYTFENIQPIFSYIIEIRNFSNCGSLARTHDLHERAQVWRFGQNVHVSHGDVFRLYMTHRERFTNQQECGETLLALSHSHVIGTEQKLF